MHAFNDPCSPPDRHDAERPFIDLLERALEQPVEQRRAYIRAHCTDLTTFDAAVQCLEAMGELDKPIRNGEG